MKITLDSIIILPDATCRPNREHIRINVEGLNYPHEVGKFTNECGFFLERELNGKGEPKMFGKWGWVRIFFNENSGNKIGHTLKWVDKPEEAIELTRNFLLSKYGESPVTSQN